MAIQLNLPADIETRLQRHTELAGQDVTSFVLDAVRDRLRDLETELTQPHGLSDADWSARLQAWADRFPPVPHLADDSRESIYEDRS